MNLCHFCRARLGEFLDGTLSIADREKVAAHLETCADCAREMREMKVTLSALHDLKSVAAPPELRLKVRAALQDEAQSRRTGRDALDFTWWRPGKMVWAGSLTLATMALLILAKPYSQKPIPLPESATIEQQEDEALETKGAEPKVAVPLARKTAPSAAETQPKAMKRSASPKPSISDVEKPVVAMRPSVAVRREDSPKPKSEPFSRPRSSTLDAPSVPRVVPRPPVAPSPMALAQRKVENLAPPALELNPPGEAPKRAKASVTLNGSQSAAGAPAPAPPTTFAVPVAPQLRFRAQSSATQSDATPALPAPDAAAPSRDGIVATRVGFSVTIAALSELREDAEQPASIMAAKVPSTGPASAPAHETSAKRAFGARAGRAAPVAKSTDNKNLAPGEAPFASRFTPQEKRETMVLEGAPTTKSGGAAGMSPIVVEERRYRLSVLAPRDLKNARVTVVLPLSLRFEANDSTHSREVWRGEMHQGKPVEIELALTGTKGGEKISVQLEQNGAKEESELLEMQIVTLPGDS